MVLDLDDAADRARLLELVDDADVVIESFAPGWLDARDVGPDALLARNPALVVTSISPFGSHRPLRRLVGHRPHRRRHHRRAVADG